MRYQTISRHLLVTAILLVCSSLMPAVTSAADAGKTGTITVSPARLNFTLAKKDSLQSTSLTLTNSYDTPVELAAEFRGITQNAGSLVPSDDLDAALTPALAISQTDILLAAHSSQTLTVQITNLASLSPGGHYATLVFTQQSGAVINSSLRAAVSLSLFVIKQGGEHSALQVARISDNGSLFRIPNSVNLQFKNTGNVHVVPRASIEVTTGGSATTISQGIANAESLPLLPGQQLTALANLAQTQSIWYPKRLTLTVAYRPDGAAQPQILTRSFWYVPPLYLLLLLLPVLIYRFRRQLWSFKRLSISKLKSTPKTSKTATKKTIITVTDQTKPAASVAVHKKALK